MFFNIHIQYLLSRVLSIPIRKSLTQFWHIYIALNLNKYFHTICSYEGRHTIHKKVPDTITSWVITGFSLDPVTGLGLTKEPKHLQVFQPFFVSIDLPYSIKRGEVLSIPVGVFNYLDDDFDVEVTLHNTDRDLEFVQMSNEVDAPSK